MAKARRNGHDKKQGKVALKETTKELDVKQETPASEGNGNKEKEYVPVLTQQSLDNLYATPEHNDNTRLLVTPGDDEDLLALLMRSAIPSKKCLLAMDISMQKCNDHGYKGGIQFYKSLLSGLPSVGDKRAQMFSDTIIGERHNNFRSHNGGIIGKMKDWAMGGGQE